MLPEASPSSSQASQPPLLPGAGEPTCGSLTSLDVTESSCGLGGSSATTSKPNKLPTGPTSILKAPQLTTSGLVSAATSGSLSSSRRPPPSVSFSSPNSNSTGCVSEVAVSGTVAGSWLELANQQHQLTNHKQEILVVPSAYKCVGQPTPNQEASQVNEGKRSRQQSSTFNAKFRVHSRRRSIGKLDELSTTNEPPPDDSRRRRAQAFLLVKPALVTCATTRQSPIANILAASDAKNKSFNNNNNHNICKQNNICQLAKSAIHVGAAKNCITIYDNSRRRTHRLSQSKSNLQQHQQQPQQPTTAKQYANPNNFQSTQHTLSRFRSLDLNPSLASIRDNGHLRGPEVSMSQTLQSIHSLSMQLNQAASLRGSSQLDDLEPPMTIQAMTNATNDKSATSSKFSRLVGKKASRVKELLLQNLGKADKTTDELFKMYEENFYRQQSQALKLQKEFKNYVQALKGAQEAGKSLNTCIQQSTGDYQSARHDLVCENLSQLDHLFEDLMDKLRSQILVSVSEYLTQFNELRDKIAKRRRKLIDFDSSRRLYELMLAHVNKKRSGGSVSRSFRSSLTRQAGTLEDGSLQSVTSQLVDESRLLKLREQYNYCKIMYETINGELHEELPMVYEKKMKNLLMTLQNYFSLEAQFHSNAGKLFATASDVIDELPMVIQPQHHRDTERQMHLSPTGQELVSDDYGKAAMATSGSSGMGSSGESSSSLNASGQGSPTGEPVEHHQATNRATISVEHHDQHDDYHMERAGNSCQQLAVRPMSEPTGNDNEDVDVDRQEEEVVGGREEAEFKELDETRQEPEADEMEQTVCMEPSGKELGRQEQVGGSQIVACYVQPGHDEPYSIAVPAISSDGEDGLVVKFHQVESETQEAESQKVDEKEAEVGEKLEEEAEADRPVELVKSEATSSEAAPDCPEKVEPASEATTTEEKTRCLYKVRTSYKYLAEDVDELCFEADEIIQVIEFDETQEQEEGWLMGVREVNGQRGLFPANFTRPE